MLKSHNHTTEFDTAIFLKILAYFDIFNHPLTVDEIRNLYGTRTGKTMPYNNDKVRDLIKENKCYEHNNYYSLNKEIKVLIQERLKKEKKAKKYINKLPFFVNLISKFPFIRGIAISGSLSKGIMYDDGDIDYFIITAPERLWICRTLLVFFKKVFLLNSKKYFCVNYFVDENNLEIIDKNMFTAIEISYLLPVFNEKLINELKIKNSWVQEFFPGFNHPLQLPINSKKEKTNYGIEFLLNGSTGDKIDLWLMKLTFKRWQKKFNNFEANKFELTMRTNRGISKHHPQDFQNKVLDELNKKMAKLEILA